MGRPTSCPYGLTPHFPLWGAPQVGRAAGQSHVGRDEGVGDGDHGGRAAVGQLQTTQEGRAPGPAPGRGPGTGEVT